MQHSSNTVSRRHLPYRKKFIFISTVMIITGWSKKVSPSNKLSDKSYQNLSVRQDFFPPNVNVKDTIEQIFSA